MAVKVPADAVIQVWKGMHKPGERMEFALQTFDIEMEGKKLYAKTLMKIWVLLIAREVRAASA